MRGKLITVEEAGNLIAFDNEENERLNNRKGKTNEEANPAGDEVALGHSGRSHMHRLHRPYVQSCGFGSSA
jgi:hypothetical protein